MNLNKVIIIGRLTRSPALRHVNGGKESGTAVTDLGLALNRKFKNGQGRQVEETTFVDVTLWARTAEVATEYLKKGSLVLIEGRLHLDQWEKEGEKRSKQGRPSCARGFARDRNQIQNHKGLAEQVDRFGEPRCGHSPVH